MDAEAGYNQSWSEMLKNTRLGTVLLSHSNDFTCWNIVNIMDDWRVGWYCVSGSTSVEIENNIFSGHCGDHRCNVSSHRCRLPRSWALSWSGLCNTFLPRLSCRWSSYVESTTGISLLIVVSDTVGRNTWLTRLCFIV